MAIWVTVSRENLLEARRQVSRSSNDLNQQSGSRNKKGARERNTLEAESGELVMGCWG